MLRDWSMWMPSKSSSSCRTRPCAPGMSVQSFRHSWSRPRQALQGWNSHSKQSALAKRGTPLRKHLRAGLQCLHLPGALASLKYASALSVKPIKAFKINPLSAVPVCEHSRSIQNVQSPATVCVRRQGFGAAARQAAGGLCAGAAADAS